MLRILSLRKKYLSNSIRLFTNRFRLILPNAQINCEFSITLLTRIWFSCSIPRVLAIVFKLNKFLWYPLLAANLIALTRFFEQEKRWSTLKDIVYHQQFGGVAQLVTAANHNPRVGGSSPSATVCVNIIDELCRPKNGFVWSFRAAEITGIGLNKKWLAKNG